MAVCYEGLDVFCVIFRISTSSLLDFKQPPSCPAQNVLMGYHSVKGHEAKTRSTRSDQVAGDEVPLNQETAYSGEMKLPLLLFFGLGMYGNHLRLLSLVPCYSVALQ